jgi:hypothetical protein
MVTSIGQESNHHLERDIPQWKSKRPSTSQRSVRALQTVKWTKYSKMVRKPWKLPDNPVFTPQNLQTWNRAAPPRFRPITSSGKKRHYSAPIFMYSMHIHHSYISNEQANTWQTGGQARDIRNPATSAAVAKVAAQFYLIVH